MKTLIILKKYTSIVLVIFLFTPYTYSQRFGVEEFKRTSPTFYYAVDDYFEGSVSFNNLKKQINKGADLYSAYKGYTVIYRILHDIATKPIAQAEKARKLFFYIAEEKKDFDFKRRYKSLPPPFTYLLSQNKKFLRGRYSSDYIGTDVIKTFVENGVSINARDKEGNTIIIYSALTNNEELLKYAIDKNADIYHKNNDGKNVLYYFIRANNLKAIKSIHHKKSINISALRAIKAENILQSSTNSYTYLADLTYPEVRNLTTFKQYVRLFPNRKTSFMKSNSFIKDKLNLQTNEIPEFISLMKNVNTSNSSEIMNTLKKEYINSANTVEQLATALGKFDMVKLNSYRSDYYTSSNASSALANDLSNLTNVIGEDKISKMKNDIKQKTQKYYRNTLNSAKSVSSFVNLKRNFPENKSEIENTCFNRIFVNADASYSASKWSEQIEPDVGRLDLLVDNCNAYISGFNNSTKKSTVSNILTKAKANLQTAESDLSSARKYENYLNSQTYKIIGEIERSESLPPFKITDTEVNGKVSNYEVSMENFPNKYGSKYEVLYKDREYYFDESFLIFASSTCNSSSMKKTLFLYIYYHTCNLSSARRDMSFYDKERLIEEFPKYGASNWYNVPIIRNRLCKN